MRNSGAVKARYSASLPVSQARIIQFEAEISAAVLSAITEHTLGGQHHKSSEQRFEDDRGRRCAACMHICVAALCAATLPAAIIARQAGQSETCSKTLYARGTILTNYR